MDFAAVLACSRSDISLEHRMSAKANEAPGSRPLRAERWCEKEGNYTEGGL